MNLGETVRDLEALRISQRAAREAGIRDRQNREALALGRLRATGVFQAHDPLFYATGVVPVEPATMDRGQVFRHLRSGGSRDGLPAEFLRDYDVSKQPGW